MNKHRVVTLIILLAAVFCSTAFQAARKASPAPAPLADPLLAAFRKVPTASISDAVDQVVKKRGFLSHDMRPIYETKIVGRAVTALLRPLSKAGTASGALGVLHSVQAIDESGPGQVVVIVIENGPDISGLILPG